MQNNPTNPLYRLASKVFALDVWQMLAQDTKYLKKPFLVPAKQNEERLSDKCSY